MPNVVSITGPSLQILGRTQTRIFLTSGLPDFQIPYKKNRHNSRTRDDIDMKLGPVTKLDKRNKTTSKNSTLTIMPENCDAIVIFRIFGEFGAVRRPDSGQ